MTSRVEGLGADLQDVEKAMDIIGSKLVIVTSSLPTAGLGAFCECGDNYRLRKDLQYDR